MQSVTDAKPLPNFHLEVTFADGFRGEIDLRPRLFGTMFEPLRDQAFFERVFVDEFGAVCWPNGADLAPDALYQELRRVPKAATRVPQATTSKDF